jgi:hypothetical protein
MWPAVQQQRPATPLKHLYFLINPCVSFLPFLQKESIFLLRIFCFVKKGPHLDIVIRPFVKYLLGAEDVAQC